MHVWVRCALEIHAPGRRTICWSTTPRLSHHSLHSFEHPSENFGVAVYLDRRSCLDVFSVVGYEPREVRVRKVGNRVQGCHKFPTPDEKPNLGVRRTDEPAVHLVPLVKAQVSGKYNRPPLLSTGRPGSWTVSQFPKQSRTNGGLHTTAARLPEVSKARLLIGFGKNGALKCICIKTSVTWPNPLN